MSRWKTLFATAVVLAALCLLLARTRWKDSHSEETATGVEELRFAHWNMESGVREALQEVVERYQTLQLSKGRLVRVVQMPIPRRMYPTWARTQLIGGTPPEIMLSMNGTDDQITARFFRPLREDINQPNPYNKGTPMEGLRWRDTFWDRMTISGFNFHLSEHYSIPFATFTTRVFMNRTLLARLRAAYPERVARLRLGPDEAPLDWASFHELCELAAQRSREHGDLIPLAGSYRQASYVLSLAGENQTQRLLLSLPDFADLRVNYQNLIVDVAKGRWSLEDPLMRKGLGLMREIGRYMPPGFMQLEEDDAIFSFVTGRALMMTVGTWNAPSLLAQINRAFEVSVFRLPLPLAGDTGPGDGVLGPFSEEDSVPSGFLGVISLHSRRKQALALDFLRFLTSVDENYRFASRSHWLPAVRGGTVPDALKAYMPLQDGYPRGISGHFNNHEFEQLMRSELHLLFSPEGGVDAYLRRYREQFPGTAKLSLDNANNDQIRGSRMQDAAILARWWTTLRAQPGAPNLVGLDVDRQLSNEVSLVWRLSQMSDTSPKP